MIRRIVKLHFKEEFINDFVKIFQEKEEFIKNWPGCLSLQLLQDVDSSSTFFTISTWQQLNDLDAYRASPGFKSTWEQIKPMFIDKAKAWSLILKS